MQKPTFTICLATYNAAATLRRAIDSILVQRDALYEIVVADGASTDSTLQILRSYGNRLRFTSESDNGIADAWNKALRMARGEWIYFLGADDLLRPDALVSASRALQGSRFQVAYAPVVCFDEFSSTSFIAGERWDPSKFRRYGMTFSHQGVFHHQSLFRVHGVFDTKFRYAADYEMLLRHLKSSDAQFLDIDPIAVMTLGGISTRHENLLDVLREYSEARNLHGTGGYSLVLLRVTLGAYAKVAILETFGVARGYRLIERVRRGIGWRGKKV